jgi:hypothetical protein
MEAALPCRFAGVKPLHRDEAARPEVPRDGQVRVFV